MIKVAIIDNGINSERFNVENDIEITPELKIRNVDKNVITMFTHGTMCAYVIKKYYDDVVFSSIKIFDENNKTSTKQVIKAIEWCIDNDIKVINMSIGTSNYKEFRELNGIVEKAKEKGCIIIAACCCENIVTYPASLKSVIGVKASMLFREGEYIYDVASLDGIEITACSKHKLPYKKLKNSCENYYATPMITAKVCEIVSKNPQIKIEEVKHLLYKKSINYLNIENVENSEKPLNISLAENFFRSISIKCEIDVPLVIFIAKEEKTVNMALHILKYYFRSEYNFSLPLATNYNSNLGGIIYVPFYNYESISEIKHKLEKIYGIYDCDLMILGMTESDYSGSIENLKAKLETDLVFQIDYNSINGLYEMVKNSIENSLK
ncbi:MAG: S8 family serine peptidase [Clostridiaceae bacterium]|nr:S8 family serine peptidase [Clostridiaceae bacterium]